MKTVVHREKPGIKVDPIFVLMAVSPPVLDFALLAP
jgi:hypothetical protein